MAASGFGTALVDNFALIGRNDPRIVTLETDPVLPIRISSITPRLFPNSNVAMAFMEYFRAFIESAEAGRGDA
jgi:hypothetical protein